MSRYIRLALFASLITHAAAGAQSASSAAQRAIQPLLDRTMQASNAHDTDAFLKYFLHDSTLVFVFNGTVVHGFTALREAQIKAWNNGHTDVAYTVRGSTEYSVLTPDVAVVTLPLGSRRTTPTGEVKTGEAVVTMVWQKRDQGWRVVAAHESTRQP